MAKRTESTSTGNHYSTVRVLAFIGLALAAVAGLISFVLWLLQLCGIIITWGERVRSICTLVSTLALFITVWLAAWDYVKLKTKVWRILYAVFLVLSILGLFGIGFF